MLKKSIGVALVALVTMTTVVACGDGGKGAADTAMQALQSSYDGIKADAAKYLPEQAKGIDEAFAAVQDTLAKGEYMKGLTDAQGLTSKVGELGAAVAAKKTELTKAFEGVSGAMPAVVEGLQAQVDSLSKAKKLPAGVTKDAVDAAKAAVPALATSWEEAAAAFKSANLTDAMAKAQAVKTKAVGLMTSLGMPVPDALK